MAAITIGSDFGAPNIKSLTVSIISPSICNKVMDWWWMKWCHDVSFQECWVLRQLFYFPYFLQFKSELGNKEFMIWATVSSWSCFCWLYRVSPSLAAKNIINLILVLTTWWRPCVESSLVWLEEGVCYDQCVLFFKTWLAFALPTTQGKTLHMDITGWSIPKSNSLYSFQPKMEKLYTVSKNKTRNWLWLRSWTPYCQIQT